MSAESQLIIKNLNEHIREIISKFEKVSSDNFALKEELLACKNELDIKNNKIKEIEKRIEEIQVAKAFAVSSTDTKEAKQKINKIVKEIDKCISLLND
jgi:hypothetical protein